MTDKKNIFIADDILIKTGYILLFLGLVLGWIAWQMVSGQKSGRIIEFNGVLVFAVLVLAIMPIAFLSVGYAIRAREKKYLMVWDILENTLEVSIDDLSNNTGLEKDTILKALQVINQRDNAFFIYDRASGLIVDGRLKSQTVAIDTCPACGHTLGFTIPLVVSQLPKCKYCGTELDASYINRLKQEKIQFILGAKPGNRPAEAAPPRQQGNFNWAVFIILLVAFWPIALVYAYVKNGKLMSRL